MDEMNRILDSTDPQSVITAGKTYQSAAKKLNEAAAVLRTQAKNLESVWKGDDADEAVKQMGRLQTSAASMAQVANETGNALSAFGPQLEWYVEHRPKKGFFGHISMPKADKGDAAVFAAGTMVAGPMGGTIALGGKTIGEALGLFGDAEKEAAQEHMNRLGGRAVEANNALPTSVTTDLPHSQRDGGIPNPPPNGGVPGGGIPGGGAGGGLGGVGGGAGGKMPDYSGVPGGGGSGLGGYPGGGAGGGLGDGGAGGGLGGIGGGGGGIGGYPGGGGSGSDLAGVGGGGAGGGLGGDPFGLGGGGGGLPGGGGGGLGGGLGGGGLGGGGLAGGLPGGMAGSGLRGAGAGSGLGAGTKGGAGGAGGAPMGGRGGGGGKGEEEHERSTWLVEDEDVWGGGDGDTAPPVIG
ncbi:WXG100 family type VII secretion target [Actinomadura atramentaria]|uniref:WXG100 family type VII secretion target n=1 Tax=Actinomadura atramentaria TaxID=1990 RepID=UPI00037F4D58|nr:WXG100 family type VII secretion target [Actinomadura atramentaria]